MKLDKKDRLILEALQRDARQSLAAIGKRIGLSQPAMSERVRKLEDAGVIEGYGARVNLRAIGIGLQAIIRIQTTHEGIRKYIALFEQMPEVLEADRVTGEDCYILKVAVASVRELEGILERMLKLGSTTTSIVVSSPVTGCARSRSPAMAATSIRWMARSTTSRMATAAKPSTPWPATSSTMC